MINQDISGIMVDLSIDNKPKQKSSGKKRVSSRRNSSAMK